MTANWPINEQITKEKDKAAAGKSQPTKDDNQKPADKSKEKDAKEKDQAAAKRQPKDDKQKPADQSKMDADEAAAKSQPTDEQEEQAANPTHVTPRRNLKRQLDDDEPPSKKPKHSPKQGSPKQGSEAGTGMMFGTFVL